MVRYLRNNEKIEDIVKDELYLVDFYADWCGPCKMFATVADKLDFIKVLKVNVDEFPDVAKEYKIMSIPALLYFKNGKLVKQVVGFQTYDEVKEIVKKI